MRHVYIAAKRRLACASPAVLAVLLVFALASCGGSGKTHRSARDGARKDASAVFGGRTQAGVLHLAAGRSTGHFLIVAPPPPKYAWNAAISSPAATDVAVNIHTWYGVDLQVLTSTHAADVCTTSGARSTCLLRFPLLEAQRAGHWTVIAKKRSGPSATVRVAITFYKP